MQQVRALPVRLFEWEFTIDNMNGKLDSWVLHAIFIECVSA